MSDIEDLITAAHREAEFTTPADSYRVLLRRSYPAAIEDVWSACTDPDRLRRWFLPVEGDLRPGGHYQLIGNAGGEILQCEAPKVLRVSWGMGEGSHSEVTVRLVALDEDSTELELDHAVTDDRDKWDRFGPGAVGVGWDLTVLGLGMHLAGNELEDKAAWAMSPEAARVITISAHGWQAAHEAAGASADTARAASEQSLAFYLPGAPA